MTPTSPNIVPRHTAPILLISIGIIAVGMDTEPKHRFITKSSSPTTTIPREINRMGAVFRRSMSGLVGVIGTFYFNALRIASNTISSIV